MTDPQPNVRPEIRPEIRIALIRHAPTEWNRAGRIQGRTDIPLLPDSEQHLRTLCLPPDWATAPIVASPLQRATRTAALLAPNRPIQSDPRLSEMNWGRWEGQRGVDLRADPTSGYRDIEFWGADWQPPDGESLREVRRRFLDWADTLTTHTLAVTHIGVIRVALALAWDWPFSGPPPFAVKRDQLYVIRRTGTGQWSADSGPKGERLPVRGVPPCA